MRSIGESRDPSDVPEARFRVYYTMSERERIYYRVEFNYRGLPFDDFEDFEEAWQAASADPDAVQIVDMDTGDTIPCGSNAYCN